MRLLLLVLSTYTLISLKADEIIILYEGIDSEVDSVKFWSFPRASIDENSQTWPASNNIDWTKLLTSARRAIGSASTSAHSAARPSSPFNAKSSTELEGHTWELNRIEISAIDVGRTPQTSLEWKRKVSDTALFTFYFFASGGSVEGRVFCLADGTAAQRTISSPTAREIHEFKYRKNEVHRPAP